VFSVSSGFFEGQDFKGEEFKALIPKNYPPKYKNYISQETAFLKSRLTGAGKILDGGVGIGRLIPELAPIVGEFVGIDNSELMIEKSSEIARHFPNVRILTCDLEVVSEKFPEKYFDYSLCVWNTLGNVIDEVAVLKQLNKVTSKSIFLTVYSKGTIEDRKKWYSKVGIEIKRIDEKKEIFYSKSGLKSKSYSFDEIKALAAQSGLAVKDHKIISGVILWVELEKS